MTNEYKKFEQGFIKGAMALGVDEPFMQGYLKYAQEVTEAWIPYVNAAEKISGDPEFRVKLAADIILLGKKQALEKCAGLEGIGGIDWMSMLDRLGGTMGGSSGLGGLLAGGGGGALVGLLLSKALGISPYLGLLLGGALGGGAGYGYGSGSFGQLPPAKQQLLNNEGPNPFNAPGAVPSPSNGQEPPAGEAGQSPAPNTAISDPDAAVVQPGKPITPTAVHASTPPPAPAPKLPAQQASVAPKPPMPMPHATAPKPLVPPAPQPSSTFPTLKPGDATGSLTQPFVPKHGSVNLNEFLLSKAAVLNVHSLGPQAQEPVQSQPHPQHSHTSGAGHDIDADTIALLQHMLSSRQYNEESAAGGQHVVPSQVVVDRPYNKDQGALDRLKDMGAQNPEQLMNPPEAKPKFNISQAFNSGHGSQQHVNNLPSAPGGAKPMQPAKPGPLGFAGSNLQQGAQSFQKQTQKALKASV